MQDTPLKTLYQSLKDNNYDVPENYDSFERTLTSDTNDRQTLYQSLKDNNYDVPDSYDSFERTLFPKPSYASQVTGRIVTNQQGGSAPMAQQDPVGKSNNVRAPFANEEAQRQYEREQFKRDMDKKVHQLEEQQKGFGERIDKNIEAVKKGTGFNNKERRYNPATGKVETVYYTPQGEETTSVIELADSQLRAYNPTAWAKKHNKVQVDNLIRSIDGQLEEAKSRATEQFVESEAVRNVTEKGTGVRKIGGAIMLSNPQVVRNMLETQEVRDLTAAKRAMDNARNIIAEADHNAKEGKFESTFAAGLGRGFGQKISDPSTWDMGVSDLKENYAILDALNSWEEGKQLTSSQQALLDAKVVELATIEYFSGELGRGYKAGGVTAESLPFMIEMICNPLSSAGRGAAKILGKYAMKRFGRRALRKGINRAVVRGASLLGNELGAALGATGLTLTTGAVRTEADAVRRMTGTPTGSFDEDGNMHFDDVDNTNRVDEGAAHTQAAISNIITNFTEMFLPEGGFAAKKFLELTKKGAGTKAGKYIGLRAVNNFFTKAGKSKIGSTIVDLERQAQWHGGVEEFLEEIADGSMNAWLVGDQSIRGKDGKVFGTTDEDALFNQDNLIDTALGVGVMSLAFPFAKTLGYGYEKSVAPKIESFRFERRVKRMMRNADDAGLNAFGGDETAWGQVRNKLSMGSEDEVKRALLEVLGSDDYSNAQKIAARDYAVASQGHRLIESMLDELRSDTRIDTLMQAYEDGYDADEQQRSDIAIEAAEGKEGAEEAWQGVRQRINDDADMMAAEQREEAKVRTNKNDGAIHPATLKETDADGNPKEVFVVDGDFSMDPEGNISGGDVIVVYDPVEGKNREISPMEISSLGDVTTAEQQEENIEANRQAYIQQQMDEANGVVHVEPGYQFTTQDGEQAVVVAVNGDDIVYLLPDGRQEVTSLEAVQQIVDDARMEAYRMSHPETALQDELQPEARQPKGAPEAFEPMMELTIRDEEGNEQQVVVTGGRASFTGKGYEDDPNGKFVELYVPGSEEPRYIHEDELKKMVTDYKEAEQPKEEVTEGTSEETQPVGDNTPADGHTAGEIAKQKKILQDRVRSWLTEENVDWAEGKELNEITERFGNLPEPIAIMPQIVRKNIPTLDSDYLYCGKAYMIDHQANHHPELGIDEYDNIQTILDSYDDIKDLSDGENLKIAFVKRLGKGYAVVAELSKENDKIVLHKTFFYRDSDGKRVPYKNKPSILKKWSEDGSTSISPVDALQQPADTENISALDQLSDGKGTNNISSVQAMPMRTVAVGKGKDKQEVEEPDFMATTAQRGHHYIYNEKGYPREVADEMVQTRHGNAANTLDELTKSEPKMSDSNIGGSMALYDKIHGEWQAKKQAAEQEVKYWEDVMAEQQKAIAAEQAALKAQRQAQKEAEQGVPDMSVDKAADARRRGYRVSMGNRFDRQEPVQGMTGNETEIKFSDNDKVKGVFKVVESQQVQPSHMRGQRNPLHFITEAQPKDRTDEVSDDKSSKMAKNINPKEITEGVTAYVGAPIINSRGEVIQGNNRAISLKKLSGYPESAAKYKQYLIDHAAEFGLNADEIAKMENPVLVREVDVTDDEAIRLGQFTANDTESGGKQRMSASNILGQLDEQKTKSLFNLLLETGESEEDMTLDQIIDRNGTKVMTWLNRNGVINATQTQSAYDSKGHMTPEAKNDLKDLITYHIFKGGSDAIGEAWGKLPVAAQKALAVAMAGDLQLKPEDRLLPDVQNAIMVAGRIENTMPEEVRSARRASEARKRLEEMEKVVKAATQQMDLTTNKPIISGYSDLEMKIAAEILSLNQSQIKAIFEEYQRYVLGTGGSLFGEATKMSRQEAVEKAFNVKDTRNGSETETGIAESGDGARAEQLGRGERPSQGAAASGEPGTAAAAEQPAGEPIKVNGDEQVEGNIAAQEAERDNAEQRPVGAGLREEPAGEAPRGGDGVDIVVLGEGLRPERLGDFEKGSRAEQEAVGNQIIENAKRNGVFIERSAQKDFGKRIGGVSGESVVYIDEPNNRVVKVKDPFAKTNLKGHAASDALYEHIAHNLLFPNTKYKLLGISDGPVGDVRFVLEQDYLPASMTPATQEQIDKYLVDNLGLTKLEKPYLHYENDDYSITDVDAGNDNVLADEDGTLYFVDPIIKFKKPAKEVVDHLRGTDAIAAAEAEVNTNPTDGQKKAGNYKMGHVKVDGYDITIENPKGSTRSGVDPNGKAWEQEMHNTYGYIRGTEGVDGDHIDVFLSDDPSQGDVFVVDQVNEDGSFDEHKVMYGFGSVEEARDAYLSNYEDGWQGLGAITPVSKEEFKKWIESSHRKIKPFSEYKSVETLGYVDMEQPKQQKAVADIEAGGAVVDKLQDMGVEVSTDIAENRRVRKQAEQDNSEAGKIHDLKNSDGKVYGFAYRGKLYLDPRKMDAELPLHEYGHLWTEAFRILNPEGWKGVVETIKQDVDGWNFIKELYPDLTTDSEIADEVIATFSGKNGAEKLKAELERIAAKNPEYKSRWGNIYNNIVKAIQDFWKKVGDFLGIKYETPEQVYDQVLRDFAAGINPRARVEEYLKERDDAYMKAAESGDVEKATEIFNKALGEEVGNGMTPFVSVGNYFDVRNLAQKVKTRDPQVIQQVAEMMAPLIPDNAVLVPAPSHGGTATDMLDLANAISKIKGCEVADVLKSTPRASQYQTKRESGRPITADKMGITQIGVLPEGKVPVVVDNVVDSGNTAEACVKALGKGLVVSLGNSADMYGHAATLKSAAPILKGRDGKIVPLSKRFDLGGSQYLGRAMQQKAGEGEISNTTKRDKAILGALVDKLRKFLGNGRVVTKLTDDEISLINWANANVRLNAAQKRTLETARLNSQGEGSKGTVVSSVDGAKILKNLDTLADKLENKSNQSKTFIGDVARAIGAKQFGSKSQYATFETKNGFTVTIRLGNHNATVSNFDNNGENNGISIVISRNANKGITNDGAAHLVEFFYPDKAISKAEGRPLAEIVRSIKQSLYSGEYKDNTGIAEREEVNARQIRFHRVFHGSGADFEAFDHLHMGEGEGAQAYGYGHYTTEVEGIGRTYAKAGAGLDAIKYKGMKGGEVYDRADERPEYDAASSVINSILSGKTVDIAIKDAIAFHSQMGENETVKEIRKLSPSDFTISDFGILYTVDIPDDNGSNYLEWDKPVTPEQQGVIYKYLRDNNITLPDVTANFFNGKSKEWTSGNELHYFLSKQLGGDKAASDFLHSAGFTGIKYPSNYRAGGNSEGKSNYVIFDDNDLKITDKVKFFRTPDGEAFGFTVGGKIYIDTDIAKADTAVHEYTHLWVPMVKEGDPKMWQEIKDVLTKDKDVQPFMEIVKQRYPELTKEGREDDFMEEVLAHFSGAKGRERLEEAAREYEEQDGQGLVSKSKAMVVLNKVKSALEKFWGKVAELFGIKFRNAQEIADKVLNDLLQGVDPTAVRSERGEAKDKAYMEAVEKGDMETARKMVDEAAREAGYNTKGYHQTANDFTVFNPRHRGSGTSDPVMPFGIFIKPTDKNIGIPGDKQMALYARIDNPIRFAGRTEMSDWLDNNVENYKEAREEYERIDKEYQSRFDELDAEDTNKYDELWNQWKAGEISEEEYQRKIDEIDSTQPLLDEWKDAINKQAAVMKELVDAYMRGSEYDGVIIDKDNGSFGRQTTTILALDPNQVKSAEPVTYDDQGNVIPLSKRFNSRKEDIRWQKSERKESERRKKRAETNNVIAEAISIVTGKDKKDIHRERAERVQKRKREARRVYDLILSGQFNDVSLQDINNYINDVTPNNEFGRHISERLPQRVVRNVEKKKGIEAVDTLFSRVCESAVRPNERTRSEGRRAIERRKNELLKQWAIATGNWHTNIKDFTDDTEPIGHGTDSDVYMARDGQHVIKFSKGKPSGKRFRPDVDNIPLFNSLFPDTAYEILGYGEKDGKFVRILQQPFVDFENSVPLTSAERTEFMEGLGFHPINSDRTAFSNGELIVADLQKSNIVKDSDGNIQVIDADVKLHTKDMGGDYEIRPVELELADNQETAKNNSQYAGNENGEQLRVSESPEEEYSYREMARKLERGEISQDEAYRLLEQNLEDIAAIEDGAMQDAVPDLYAQLKGQQAALRQWVGDKVDAGAERRQGAATMLQQAQQAQETYVTNDGVQLNMDSLLYGTEQSDAGAVAEPVPDEQQTRGKDITDLRLRKLKPGETCHVERRYEESRQFSFTGKDKIESMDDVAYIFKQLETAAVENSFLVLVKDGKPTVIHLGMGGYTSAGADFRSAFAAYNEMKPDEVYFVHNHPSGTLKASLEDRKTLDVFTEVFGGRGVVKDGIIIDTTSGKYGVFGVGNVQEKAMPSESGDDVPMKVYTFSKQVFSPDWNPQEAFKITDSGKVAEFVSSHRLGEHKKMSLIVVNNSGSVVGNFFLPWTKLSDIKDNADAVRELSNYVNLAGGTRCVLYGNYEYTSSDKKALYAIAKAMKTYGTELQDVIHVSGSDDYHSARDSGVMEPVGEYKSPAMKPGEDYIDYAMRVSDSYKEYENRKGKAESKEAEPTKQPEPFKAPAKEQGEDMVSYAKRVADAYRVYQEGVPKIAAREAYERSMGYGANQFKEAVQDSMLSLKELYRAILGKDAKIEDVKGYENAYLAENRMHSASEAQAHAYQQDFIAPIVDAIYDLIGHGKFNKEKYDDLVDYMMAKHGLERNRVFAERDAQAAAKKGADYDEELQKNRQRDYAGLTALTGESDVATAEAMAQKLVDDYEANHDTTALWEKINRATKQSLYTLYSSGMMTKERYEQIRDMFDYYIPLQGFDSTIAEDVYAYLGSDGTLGYGTPIRTAKGRRSKADDPIATIAMNGEAAIRSANRNEMKKNFLNFVQNHPSDLVSVSEVWLKYNDVTGEWEQVTADLQEGDSPADVERKTKAFDKNMENLSKDDPDHYKKASDMPNVPYRVVKSGDMKQHQVTVKRNGKDYVLTINGNPRAAQALNGLTNPDVFTEGVFGKAMNLGQWLNRQLSAFYTTRNPEFVLSNFLRDAIYSNMMVGTKEDSKYAAQFHKNFVKMNPVSMGKLFASWENGSLREKVRQGTCTETERMFYDFMMNGGETGWTNMRDIEKHKKEIQNALKMEGSTNRKAWKALSSAFDLMNRSVENCARFAAFVTSREMGRSLERSILDAKEISVNFNKKGAGDKFLTANNQTSLGKIGAGLGGLGRGLFVFWNASVQGLNNIASGAKKSPWKFVGRIVATNFLLGALMPILNEILTGGDDDKNSYYNLPEYIRRSNICFRFSKDMPWITIPLPIEFRAIYGLGELATGVLTGKERYNDEEFAKQFVSQLSQVLPLDFMEGGGGWHALIPSQFKPLLEAHNNKSWTGLPIYKDTPFNKNDPEWTKAYKSANKQLVEATKWLNDLTNGKDYAADEKKGWIDINPAKLEYMLKGYFGGYTTMLDRFVKTAETVFGDRDFEWRNIPMASRVLKEGDERTANRKITNEYYNLLDEYDETKSIEKKKREKAESGDYIAKADYVAWTNFNENYKKAQVIDNFKPLLDALKDEKKHQSEYSLAEIEERENELRREMVDIIHSIQDAKKGQIPDIETPVDNMLDREFDRHGYTSKAAASRIASRMGGTDGYGHPDKDDKKGQVYYNLRDHYDLRQDVAMQVAIKQAKDAGDEGRAKDLESARRAYNELKNGFEYTQDNAVQILETIRLWREDALTEFGIPFDKRPEKGVLNQ